METWTISRRLLHSDDVRQSAVPPRARQPRSVHAGLSAGRTHGVTSCFSSPRLLRRTACDSVRASERASRRTSHRCSLQRGNPFLALPVARKDHLERWPLDFRARDSK